MRCAVIGLGSIGYAVYRDLEAHGFDIIGLDIDSDRLEKLRRAGLNVTDRYEACKDIDVWIVCTSTGPEMETIYAVANRIRPQTGALVSVESTLQIGTMQTVASRFEARGYVPGRDFYLVHVPHRIMFGRDRSTFAVPRVIGGVTHECLDRGYDFYRTLSAELFPVPDVRVAELAKTVENGLRYVEIAFAEAVAGLCTRRDIDFELLREAVNTKDNVHLAQVDYGIGGECLAQSLDLLQRVYRSPVFEGAFREDARYRRDLAERVLQRGNRVLVRGVGYKPGASQLKWSRGVELARRLMDAGCIVHVHDPAVPEERLTRAGLVPVKDDDGDYDVVVERGRLISTRRLQGSGV